MYSLSDIGYDSHLKLF